MINQYSKYRSSKSNIVYHSIPSAMKPIPHRDDLPVSTAPLSWQEISDSEEDSSENTAVLQA